MENWCQAKRGSYSREFKETAVLEVIDQSRPIADVARQLELVEQTVGNWVKAYRAEHAGDAEPELSLPSGLDWKELERAVRELKMENDSWENRWPSLQGNSGYRRIHRPVAPLGSLFRRRDDPLGDA